MIKAKIRPDPMSFNVDIYLYEESAGDTVTLYQIKNGRPEVHEVISRASSTAGTKPTLTLPGHVLEVLASSLLSAGYTPEEKGYVQGKLDATEKHLETALKITEAFIKNHEKSI